MAKDLAKAAESKAKDKKLKEKKNKKKFLAFFKDMITEMKKVTWPTWPDLRNYTLTVLGFVFVSAIIIGAMDFGLAKLFHWLSDSEGLPSLLKDLFS